MRTFLFCRYYKICNAGQSVWYKFWQTNTYLTDLHDVTWQVSCTYLCFFFLRGYPSLLHHLLSINWIYISTSNAGVALAMICQSATNTHFYFQQFMVCTSNCLKIRVWNSHEEKTHKVSNKRHKFLYRDDFVLLVILLFGPRCLKSENTLKKWLCLLVSII